MEPDLTTGVGIGTADVDGGGSQEAHQLDASVVVGGRLGEACGHQGGEPVDGVVVVGALGLARCDEELHRVVELDRLARPYEHAGPGPGLVLVDEADRHDPQGVGPGVAGAEGDARRARLQRLEAQGVVDRALGEDADHAVDGQLDVAGRERLGVALRALAVLAAARRAARRPRPRSGPTPGTFHSVDLARKRTGRGDVAIEQSPDRRTRWRGWRRPGSAGPA